MTWSGDLAALRKAMYEYNMAFGKYVRNRNSEAYEKLMLKKELALIEAARNVGAW